MKTIDERAFTNPETAVRKLIEIAKGIEPSRTAASTLKRSMRRFPTH
ncbi:MULTISPECIES: hypothetical protein [unclassified Bradyrhizobium]